jgi:hypothetical protein
MVVEFICAKRQCHILDSDIVRDFRVDLVLPAIGALDDSIVDSIVGFVIVGKIVGSAIRGLIVGYSIVGSIVRSAIVGSIVGSPI